LHAVRVDRAVHADQSRTRRPHSVHVRDRPPAGCASCRDRAVRACGARSRSPRVAPVAGDAVEVPLRRRCRRPSTRSAGAGRAAGTGSGDAHAARCRSLRRSRGASMTAAVEDPYVLKVRREISDVDNALVALVNKRLRLVAQLKRYKDEHGIGFVDLAREEWMLQYLQRANSGPLSAEGLSELYHEVLDLVKREVARG